MQPNLNMVIDQVGKDKNIDRAILVQTLEQAIQGWLNSPGHRATLLSTRFVEFGLAVAKVAPDRKSRYGTYWAFIAGGPFEAWKNG